MLRSSGLIVAILTLPFSLGAATIDFEGLPDSSVLTNQYPGLTFSNAIILTAGISLNEFEFPPHSGANVVSDYNGPMSINFDNPVTSVGGYFTYSEALTLLGFDSSGNQVATEPSPFSNNEAISGIAGSSPNEFLSLAFPGGISAITITGDPNGGSFALDDLTYTASASSVPEPGTLGLIFAGATLTAYVRVRLCTRARPHRRWYLG